MKRYWLAHKGRAGALDSIKEAARTLRFAGCCLGAAGMGLSIYAQSGRDSYRQAFDAWQQAQTNLERDAGAGTDEQVAQATRAAAAAKTFEAARAAYLKSSGEDAARRRKLLQTPSVQLLSLIHI